MILIDTSVFVPIFRDMSGSRRSRFRKMIRGREFALTRFTQLELLRGCSSPEQWEELSDYLEAQDYLEMEPEGWAEAARIHFDLRRRGFTVNSILDCCIAQIAIDRGYTLIHNDMDFETMKQVCSLKAW